MNTAEWILVAILSVTLFVFLVVGIVLFIRFIKLSDEMKKVVVESQDIAKNANGIVSNVKGMTSIGGTMEMFVDKYINPKLKEKIKEKKEEEKERGGKKKKRERGKRRRKREGKKKEGGKGRREKERKRREGEERGGEEKRTFNPPGNFLLKTNGSGS